jgi:formamidopyrimidine-DNA glycosylase
MPELPEVETIKRDLAKHLLNKSVTRIEVKDRRLLSDQQAKLFSQQVLRQPWSSIYRKGKYLCVHLGSGWEIIFHLRMTGQLVLDLPDGTQHTGILDPPESTKYRLLLEFENGTRLSFYDQRRFGEVFLKSSTQAWPGKTAIGPDPLDELSRESFVQMLRAKSTRVKPLLMDQSFVAGVGNIYAQEALFKAAIRPSRPGRRISRAEAAALFDALRETLLDAIEHRGSTARNYRDAYGQSGTAQTLHAVYQRGGKPCLKCKSPLSESRLGGRGTVFCTRCQR